MNSSLSHTYKERRSAAEMAGIYSVSRTGYLGYLVESLRAVGERFTMGYQHLFGKVDDTGGTNLLNLGVVFL